MLLAFPELQSLQVLARDGRLLFSTRVVRLFAYGLLSVILVLYLVEIGLDEGGVGVVLTLSLLGDAAISLWIATLADRLGRRRMLLLGAGLMVLAGTVFMLTSNPLLLVLAAIIGTLSPSGAEVGPFLSIEQAALPQTVPPGFRTQIFAWYNLAGSAATALGALCGGLLVQVLQHGGLATLASYRACMLAYTTLGCLLALLFSRLSPAIEAQPAPAGQREQRAWLGLHRSRGIVVRLSALFMLDAFAGGLVVQSIIAYWFHRRWGVDPAMLGAIFFGANLLAAVSALAAARIAARVGLINTMVWTHIPSNVLLILVPLMPSLPLAIAVLLVRFSISQMDVPTRQSYTMAVVAPDERSAAAGLTSIARTSASALAPLLTGLLLNAALWSLPFMLAGGLKIVYDLLLYRSFRTLKPPDES